MRQTPLPSLQTLEPINESDFAVKRDVRERMGSLSRWAMADHFGRPVSSSVTEPPAAAPTDLRDLTSAVQELNADDGATDSDAIPRLAARVRRASEQLATNTAVTAEQRSDIEQLWQAIVRTEQMAR